MDPYFFEELESEDMGDAPVDAYLDGTLGAELDFVSDTPEQAAQPEDAKEADTQDGYAGELDETGRRHGDGVQVFGDGRRYSGQFEMNTFSGAAIIVWPDGHRYTGQYESNLKHGDGYFLWP